MRYIMARLKAAWLKIAPRKDPVFCLHTKKMRLVINIKSTHNHSKEDIAESGLSTLSFWEVKKILNCRAAKKSNHKKSGPVCAAFFMV